MAKLGEFIFDEEPNTITLNGKDFPIGNISVKSMLKLQKVAESKDLEKQYETIKQPVVDMFLTDDGKELVSKIYEKDPMTFLKIVEVLIK